MRIEITNVESDLNSAASKVSFILNGQQRSATWGEIDQLGQDRLKSADRGQTAEQCLLAQAALLLRARKMQRGGFDSQWWAGLCIDQSSNTADGTYIRRIARVWFSNGDTLLTEINGTECSIRQYYIGQSFNLGNGEDDNLVLGRGVEFL